MQQKLGASDEGGYLGDGDELEKFTEQRIVDHQIQHFCSDAPLCNSALGLIVQLQQPAGEELQDGYKEDGHHITEPPGMAAFPQMVFHQAHSKD